MARARWFRAPAEGKGDKTDRGILSTHLHSDGRHYDLLATDGGPGSTGTTGHVRMEGKEVFRHAVLRLAEVVDEALAANHLKPEEIDLAGAASGEQPNHRKSTAKKLNMPPERVVLTIADHANTFGGIHPAGSCHRRSRSGYGRTTRKARLSCLMPWAAGLLLGRGRGAVVIARID